MRRIAIVSVGRSDRGHLQPVVEALGEEGHLISAPVSSFKHENDTPHDITFDMAGLISVFATDFRLLKPDLILLFGDRYEQLAAAMASLPFAIPLAHLHGGETTQGAFDNQIRNALTKMSHLHFVAHAEAGRRVLAMGEESWRVHVTGAPGLDRIPKTPAHNRRALASMLGIPMGPPWILTTLHPCTLAYQDTGMHVTALLNACVVPPDAVFLFTPPNADTYGALIRQRIEAFAAEAPARRRVLLDLDDTTYLSLMACADVMLGNSSSGIIEAPTLRLPVVNIGDRQKGRLRGNNVIDVPYDAAAILDGLKQALTPRFGASLNGVNPYGDGHAAPRIAEVLRTVALDRRLVEKP